MTDNSSPLWIRWFSNTSAEDVPLGGGKNASLGEIYRELGAHGIKVPNGFAVTAAAYREVLDRAGAWPKLRDALAGLDANNVSEPPQRAQKAREIVYGSPLPEALVNAMVSAYGQPRREYGEQLTLAVRSSATAEDLPTASFAGQHETFLNISGEFKLLDAIRRCFASLFLECAICYRIDNGFDHFKVLLLVGIMKMVRSDLAASGVTFWLDTETGFRDVVFVTAAYGLGENVVQGTVDPDQFYVFKPTFRQGHRGVLWRSLGSKKIRMVYTEAGGRETTHNESTPKADRERYCLTDEEVLQVADATMRIEVHCSGKAGHPVPMDVEWAKDGVDGQIYVVQAPPETLASRKSMDIFEKHSLRGDGRMLIAGHAVGRKAASGKARVISDVAQLDQFGKGEVLVADTTAPDWVTVMKAAAAIVTNRGGRNAAVRSRNA